MGRSIPYFLALWQEDKCFIALPMPCAMGTKQWKPRSGCSGEEVPRVALYLFPDIRVFLQHQALEMFEHCQHGVQVIPWIAHLKDADSASCAGYAVQGA